MRLRLHKKLLALVLATVICLSLTISVSAASTWDATVCPPYEVSDYTGESAGTNRLYGGTPTHSHRSQSTKAHLRLSQHPQSRRVVCNHQKYLQVRPPGAICN